jgi:nucleoside-diphosphate-sugar epimerase
VPPLIFASSIHAVIGYPKRDATPDRRSGPPLNMYGASKCFGEATASVFAAAGLSSIAIGSAPTKHRGCGTTRFRRI